MVFNKKVKEKKKFLAELSRFSVFEALRTHGPLAVDDIMRLTGLSKPTVVNYLRGLERAKLVVPQGFGPSTGGRAPVLYEFASKSHFVVGVEFEIPKVRLGVTDLGRKVVARATYYVSRDDSADTIMQQLIAQIENLLVNGRIPRDKVYGIGLGLSGFLNNRTGVYLESPRAPHWKNVPIRARLQMHFGVPVFIEALCNVLALGELGEKTPISNNDNVGYIGFVHGLGAGVFLNGQLYQGRFGNVALLGHTTVDMNGDRCYCGNRGCLELYASGRALERRFKSLMAPDNPSSSSRLALPGEPTSEQIILAANDGDPICRWELLRSMDYLAVGIANMVDLFELQTIILGGDLALAGEWLAEYVQAAVQDRLMNVLKQNLRVLPATMHPDDAGIVGASTLVLREIFRQPTLDLSWSIDNMVAK
ncbi:MAG: ROK family transcriptional regulator [Firmicutes bacterium]|nr:ROK family transcriptional regulator [Bacillota bacterium]